MPKGTQEWSDPPMMLSPKGPPAFTKTTSSILGTFSFVVTRLTVVSLKVRLVTVSVVTPALVGAAGNLETSSRTLSSGLRTRGSISLEVTEVESEAGLKIAETPGSLPRLEVEDVEVFLEAGESPAPKVY